MSPGRRLTALLPSLLVGLVVLSACEPAADKGADSGGSGEAGADGGSDGGDDAVGDGNDGDDGGDATPAALAVLDVSAAVDGVEGGPVSLRVRPLDGGQVCVHGCGLSFLVDDEPVAVPLEPVLEDDGTTTLTGTLPAGLATSGAALADLVDGETVVGQAPVRLRWSGALNELSPLEEGAPRASRPDPAEGWSVLRSTTRALESLAGGVSLAGLASCCTTADDSDVMFYNISEGALVADDIDVVADDLDILGAHLGRGAVVDDADPILIDDFDLTAELDSPAYAAGPGDAHYGSITLRRAGEPDALLAVVAQAGMLDAHVVVPGAEGSGAVEPVSLSLALEALPDRVLDIAPLVLSDGSLSLGVLGLREEDVGKWRGIWFDGRKAYPFDRLGGVSADELAAGTAFAGLVHTGAVREPVSPTSATFWSVDPASAGDGCYGTVGLHGIGSTVTNLRTLKLRDRASGDGCDTVGDLRAAAAVALDGDEDGSLDLVLQLWGADPDGTPTHSDHFFSDATNPRGTASGVRLDPVLAAPGHAPAELGSWTLTGASEGVPTGARASADHVGGWLSLDGVRYPRLLPQDGVLPSSWQSVRNVWSSAALAAAAADSASGPVALTAENGGVIEHHAKKSPPPKSCSGRGICIMGRCSCLPGGGSSGLRLGAGDGAGDPRELGLSAGERTWLRDGPRPTLHRVALGDQVSTELTVGGADFGSAAASVVVDPGSGSTFWLEGGREPLVLDQADTVQFWMPELDDEVVVGLWVGDDPERTTAAHASTRPRLVGIVGPERLSPPLRLPLELAGEGTTRPVLLGASADGDPVIALRRSDGQAFVGVVDRAAAETAEDGLLPFAAGPLAVGGANPDLFDMLVLHDDRPLAVGFRAGPPAAALLADTGEARALRYPERTTAAGLPTGPVVMLTVDLAGGDGPQPEPDAVCTLANLTLPVAAIGAEDWADQAWVERATEPDCSDLAQPLAAGVFFADGREGVFRVDGTGQGSLTALLDETEAASISSENPVFESGSGANSNVLAGMIAGSGDIDGDGIEEAWIRAWGDPGALVLGWSEGSFGVVSAPGELDHAGGFTETTPGRLDRTLREQPTARATTPVGDLRY